jgi:hypothetical protein
MLLTVTAIILFLALAMEVAAIGLKLTGMDMERARFQALSSLTGTGFTTREAECITQKPIRRRIVMSLMILGHIGLTAIVISAVNIRMNFSWWQILLTLSAILITLRITTDKFLLTRLDATIEGRLIRFQLGTQSLAEVLVVDERFGVAEVDIPEGHPLADKNLAQANLRSMNILVLAIKGDNEVISAPGAEDKIRANDVLVVYGEMEQIKNLVT